MADRRIRVRPLWNLRVRISGRAIGLVFDPERDAGPISSACAEGEHQECGHVRIGMRRFLSADRLQSTIVLCGCDCHASCPLAGRAPVLLTAWRQFCTGYAHCGRWGSSGEPAGDSQVKAAPAARRPLANMYFL